jgi:hypothetical protein
MIRRFFVAALLALISRAVSAQMVAAMPDGSFVVAHDDVVELYARNARDRVWSAEGVRYAGGVVVSNDRIAVLDPIANRVRLIDAATGKGESISTGETPIDGAFIDRNLYLLERDARILERIAPDGTRAAVSLAADPAFLRVASGRIFVYSRSAGVVQEITKTPFALARSVTAGAYASDFETDGMIAYTVHPRGGLIRMTDLATGKATGEVRVGAVPIDLAFAGSGTALTARTLAIADPSAKRVWMIEGKQSFMQAFARGFLRGFLGLGLFGGREPAFETGVDRVFIRGSLWVAYDSSSGTIYRFSRKKTVVLARGVPPGGFTVVPGAVIWWQNGTLVAQEN